MDDSTRDEYQADIRRLRGELTALRGGGEGSAEAPSPPLRQRDILRALLDERRARAHSLARATVRLTRNAKGDVQPEVLVELSGEHAGEVIAEAQAEATRVFDALCLVYSLDAPPRRARETNGGGDD